MLVISQQDLCMCSSSTVWLILVSDGTYNHSNQCQFPQVQTSSHMTCATQEDQVYPKIPETFKAVCAFRSVRTQLSDF